MKQRRIRITRDDPAASALASVVGQVLGRKQAAAVLGVGLSTVDGWRYHGIGPRWIMLGPKRIGYRLADLETWLNQQTKRCA
jgi:predicted DNA-binding transcriptional regulator AlpA